MFKWSDADAPLPSELRVGGILFKLCKPRSKARDEYFAADIDGVRLELERCVERKVLAGSGAKVSWVVFYDVAKKDGYMGEGSLEDSGRSPRVALRSLLNNLRLSILEDLADRDEIEQRLQKQQRSFTRLKKELGRADGSRKKGAGRGKKK